MIAMLVGGCGAQGDTAAQQRQAIQTLKQDTLKEVRARYPEATNALAHASGYGVFAANSSKIMVVGLGSGYGVVHDNRSGRETYMKMAQAGAGLGLGINQTRTLMVFHTPESLHGFIDNGVMVGASAQAAAKYQDKGKALSGKAINDALPEELRAASGVSLYQVTDNGLVAQAMVNGYKYWPDSALN